MHLTRESDTGYIIFHSERMIKVAILLVVSNIHFLRVHSHVVLFFPITKHLPEQRAKLHSFLFHLTANTVYLIFFNKKKTVIEWRYLLSSYLQLTIRLEPEAEMEAKIHTMLTLRRRIECQSRVQLTSTFLLIVWFQSCVILSDDKCASVCLHHSQFSYVHT